MGKTVEAKYDIKKILKWVVTVFLPILIYFLIPRTEVFTPGLRKYLVITSFIILTWIFDLMPVFVSGMFMVLLYILTGTAPAAVVLENWSGFLVWLIFGGMIISVAFEKTNLMNRIAYHTIIKAGASYRGIVIGLITSGIIITTLLPNITGRVALYSALAYGICRALDLKPNSQSAAGIMLSGFLGAVASRGFVLCDNNLTALTLSREFVSVAWIEHFKANAPLALVWVAVMITVTLFLFKPDSQIQGREYFQTELAKLGKIKTKEIKLLIILIITLLGIIFTDVQIGWLFMLAACVCMAPGIDVINMKDLREVNFSMVVFAASAMAIGSVAKHLDFVTLVSNSVLPWLERANSYMFFAFCWILGVILNLLMTPLSALSAFAPMVAGIAHNLGLSVNGALYSFVWGVEQLLFPYEWVVFLIAFSYGMFDSKQGFKFCISRLVISFIYLMVVMIPYWMFVGFVR